MARSLRNLARPLRPYESGTKQPAIRNGRPTKSYRRIEYGRVKLDGPTIVPVARIRLGHCDMDRDHQGCHQPADVVEEVEAGDVSWIIEFYGKQGRIWRLESQWK